MASSTSTVPSKASRPAINPAAISVENLVHRYEERTALDGISFNVQSAELFGLLGPNGSGKTTLLRALTGDITPDSGEVVAARAPGLLPQTHDDLPPAASVLDFFRAHVAVYADDAERLLDGYLFGRDQWGASLRTLSAGELRRLLLAVLVNGGSRILLLDEPTNYLDFDALDVVEEALRAYRGTLVIVTHDEYFAERVGVTRHWRVEDAAVTEKVSP